MESRKDREGGRKQLFIKERVENKGKSEKGEREEEWMKKLIRKKHYPTIILHIVRVYSHASMRFELNAKVAC